MRGWRGVCFQGHIGWRGICYYNTPYSKLTNASALWLDMLSTISTWIRAATQTPQSVKDTGIHQWMSRELNEWTGMEWNIKEWNGMNEGRKEGDEWLNDMTWHDVIWPNLTWREVKWSDWMNERMNEWMDERVHEWMKWMHAWVHETKKGMKWVHVMGWLKGKTRKAERNEVTEWISAMVGGM